MKTYTINDLSKHMKQYHNDKQLQEAVDYLNEIEEERSNLYQYGNRPKWYQSNSEAFKAVDSFYRKKLQDSNRQKLKINDLIDVMIEAQIGITVIEQRLIGESSPILAIYDYDRNEYRVVYQDDYLFRSYMSTLHHFYRHNQFIDALIDRSACFAKYEPLRNHEVPVKNGIFNTLTGMLEEDRFGPEITVLNRIHFDYKEDKYKDNSYFIQIFNQFLDHITNSDDERRHLAYQIIKCAVVNKGDLTKTFIFMYGSGFNGKETFMEFICRMLNSTCQRFEPHTYQAKNSISASTIFNRVAHADGYRVNDNSKNHNFFTHLGRKASLKFSIPGYHSFYYASQCLFFLQSNRLLNVFNNSQVRKYATTLRFVKSVPKYNEQFAHEIDKALDSKDVYEYLLSYILNEDLVPFFDRFSGIDNIPNVQFDFFTNFIDELLRSDVFDNEILSIGYLYQVYKRFAEDHSSDNWQVDTSILSLQKFKAKMEPLLQECGYEDIGQQSISELRNNGSFDDKKNYFSFNDQMMRALFTNSQQIAYTQKKSVCFKLVDNAKLKQRYNQMMAYENISAYDYTTHDIYHY